MADINVILPTPDASLSVETSAVVKTNGTEFTIANALENKNNTLQIFVEVASGTDITVKAGNAYPNAILGDCKVKAAGDCTVIILEDIARFENKDGSVKVALGAAGNVFAVAKRAGLDPQYANIYNTDKSY